MALGASILYIVLAFLLLLGRKLIYFLPFARKKTGKNPKFVKKVPGYPLLGNVLSFLPDKIIGFFQEVPKKYGPFAEINLFGRPALIISDINVAKEVFMKRPKKFRRTSLMDYSHEKLNLTHGLFASEGNVWYRVRKATTTSFSPSALTHKYSDMLGEIFDWAKYIHNLSQKNPDEPIDMRKESFALTIRVITVVAFGLELNHPLCSYFLTDFQPDMLNIMKFSGDTTLYPFPRWTWKYSSSFQTEIIAMEANERFTKKCLDIINYKRDLLKQGKLLNNCMLDSLIYNHDSANASGDKGLTDEEIVANVKVFYLAGGDTTAITLFWLAYYLSIHPFVMDKIEEETKSVFMKDLVLPNPSASTSFDEIFDVYRSHLMKNIELQKVTKDLPYTSAVIKEALRLASPAPLVGVESISEAPMILSNGILIDYGELIYINFDGIHRNPEVFDDPNTFSPDRWLIKDEDKLLIMENSYIPFSLGPRVCPGMSLAMNELYIGLIVLSLFFRVHLGCAKEEIVRTTNFVATANKMPILFETKKSFH